jgi:hypothetical protein
VTASPLSGKGIWIRRIAACEQGDLAAIVGRAQAAGFTHVFLKIADGADAYNADALTGHALELTRRLRDAGLDVWGWHYLYGDKPRFKGRFQSHYHQLEADCAVQVVGQLRAAGLQGYVACAEGEYERAPGRADQADEFVARVRAGLGNFPLALASWKFPNSHKRFPWAQFRQHCVVDLPQVFWLGRHREAPAQLQKSFQQYAALEPRLPYAPVAPAFFENGWQPSPLDLEQFALRAATLGLPGFSLWAWDFLGLRGDEPTGNPERLDFRAHWQVVEKVEWRETRETKELRELREAGEEVEVPEELVSFGIEAAEAETAIAFGLPTTTTEPAFTPEPVPAAEADEIRARVQGVAERYADSLRDLRAAHRDELIALGAQALLGATAKEETPSLTLSGHVVGEAPPAAPAPEVLPDEWLAEWESLTTTEADEDTELPEWLREGEAAELADEDAEPTRPFAPEAEAAAPEMLPDEWLAELEALTTTEVDEETELPEWLREGEAAELADEDAEPARPFAPEAEAVGPEVLPDEWLAELEALTTTEVDEETELLEWLREGALEELSEEDAEPARPFAPEADVAAPEGLPDEWLVELEALTTAEIDEETELPEWLREGATLELTEEDAEPARPFTPETEAGAPEGLPDEWLAELELLTMAEADEEAELPEWLREGEAAELADEDAEPARPFAPDAETIALELSPDELAAELESLTADADRDEDLPEWLQDFDVEAIEARLSEEDAEPTRPFAPEPEFAIGTFIAPPAVAASPVISKLFKALSVGRLEEAFRQYAPEFTLVHAQHLARDRAGLRRFYLWLLPGLQRETLVVRSLHVNRLTVQAHWACQTRYGKLLEGSDTFHLNRRDQIVYHHTTLDFDSDTT